MIKTVEWTSEGVRMIDQRLLPTEEKYLTLRSYEEVADAIKKMVVRGAPAIGVSAAMGLALGASQSVGTSVADLEFDFKFMCKVMEATRPTAGEPVLGGRAHARSDRQSQSRKSP
jgi:methylthioribose-1-phosphate isomerase